MKRMHVVAISLALLSTAAVASAREPYDEIQAPRGEEIQAPRGQEIQAPRG